MKRYEITIRGIIEENYDFYAENEEEAKELSKNFLSAILTDGYCEIRYEIVEVKEK